MGKEDTLKFTNSIILVSKLLDKIEDKFLARKLYGKISDAVSAFLEFQKADIKQASHNVTYQKLLNSVNSLLDYLEYLAYILKNEVTPLLVAQRNLLKLKLHLLKQAKTEHPKSVIDTKNEQISKPNLKQRISRPDLKQGSNKEKILNFIKKFPDIRTKEIIDEFNIMSGRTVKRNLKELIDEGFLEKKSENGAVYYLAISH